MKRRFHDFLDESFARFRKLPKANVDTAWEHVIEHANHESAEETTIQYVEAPVRGASIWRPRLVGVSLAGIVLTVLLPAMMGSPAVLEDGEGSRNIAYGEVVRPNGSSGGTLQLPDGTRVEMRSESELSLERAEDGVKVRLRKGDVIVDATAPLEVETRDVTAVGKTFFVNAQEEGSRVAALEGEARVQQGATATRLLPGEQVATNPNAGWRPMREAGGWSAQASRLVAQMPQPARRDAFEVASVRPSAGGPRGATGPLDFPCNGAGAQVDRSRFAAPYISLYRLITWAYGKNCMVAVRADLLRGGPGWVRSDPYSIEATLPPGSPAYTTPELLRGDAPTLQKMLQTLLAERFKLTLRTETKDAPGYNLVMGRDLGRLKLSEDQTPVETGTRTTYSMNTNRSTGVVTISASAVPIQTLWDSLLPMLDRPVVNKTDLKGLYDIPQFQFTPEPQETGKSQVAQILEQLGLKLEPVSGPMDVLVIDHVERPTEN